LKDASENNDVRDAGKLMGEDNGLKDGSDSVSFKSELLFIYVNLLV